MLIFLECFPNWQFFFKFFHYKKLRLFNLNAKMFNKIDMTKIVKKYLVKMIFINLYFLCFSLDNIFGMEVCLYH